jgi:hypothetical protein
MLLAVGYAPGGTDTVTEMPIAGSAGMTITRCLSSDGTKSASKVKPSELPLVPRTISPLDGVIGFCSAALTSRFVRVLTTSGRQALKMQASAYIVNLAVETLPLLMGPLEMCIHYKLL